MRERESARARADLVNAVEELEEERREGGGLAGGAEGAALAELVSEREPLLLQQQLEALQGAVERVA